MTGKTNANMGGKSDLTLIWTNSSPNTGAATFTVTANFDCSAFVVDCKRFTDDNVTNGARNYVAKNTQNQRLMGFSTNANSGSWARLASATQRVLTMTTVSGMNPVDTIPLRVYAIKE